MNDAFVGERVVDWKAWVNKLKEIGYAGWAIVEVDATDNPSCRPSTPSRLSRMT